MSGTETAAPPSWTLGKRQGQHCWYCTYCGRNCVADRVPYVVLPTPDETQTRLLFACVCCASGECAHSQMMVIECEKCRRPVARFGFAGGRVRLIGSIGPEGTFRGGGRTPTSPTWRSRIWDVSPEGAAWDPGSPGEIARFKLVCLGRRHRTEKLVTESGLEISYVQARRDGRARVRLCDIGH